MSAREGMVQITLVRLDTGADRIAAVFVREATCLDDARELAGLVTRGTSLHLVAEDGARMRWAR